MGVPYRRCCRRSSSFFILHCAALPLPLLLLLLLLRRCWVAATAAALPPACLRACPPASVFFFPPSSAFFVVAFSLFCYPPQSAHADEFLVQKKLRWLLKKERKREGRTEGVRVIAVCPPTRPPVIAPELPSDYAFVPVGLVRE